MEPDELTLMFNNYAQDWRLNDQEIAEAVALFATDNPTTPRRKRKRFTPNKLLLFLYAKQILAEESSLVRSDKFKRLLKGETSKLREALQRLQTIVETGETTPTRRTMQVQSLFEEFVVAHPEWNSGDDVFVIFRDHPHLKGMHLFNSRKTACIGRAISKKRFMLHACLRRHAALFGRYA
jgi:hypothetical protein